MRLSPVSAFTGPLKHRETSAPKMCDACGVHRAQWRHEKLPGKVPVYLCFGCGGH